MIVISNNLVLNETPTGVNQPNANNPIVGWENLVTVNNITTTTESLSFPAINMANPSTYLRWEATAIPAPVEYITVATGTPDSVDYIAVAGHNWGTGQFIVSIEGTDGTIDSNGDFEWFELVQQVMLADDAPVLFRFTPQSLSSIRIVIQGGSVIPRAAVIYVGLLLVLERRIYVGHKPITFARNTNFVTGRSEQGQFLGRIVLSQMTSNNISMKNITPAFYRSDVEPWFLAAATTPFFFAWRPLSYPNEVGFCWATNDGTMTNQLANGMVEITMGLQGIVA